MGAHRRNIRKLCLAGTAMAGALALTAAPAYAQEQTFELDVPSQRLDTALRAFAQQSRQQLMFAVADTKGFNAPALNGSYTADQAIGALLAGTGLEVHRNAAGVFLIASASDPQGGSAGGGGAEVEALIVTAQKREEDIQDVPIAISAFSQEDLTRSQVAGGPDLMTQVPNMTFTKTNFTSYSIQIRGIGTQAVSATTDAAVAVALNNTPFIRNRFFEQEFYDLQRVEVLRGPQGTLYGRNATAGVVNIISAKPKFAYEAKLSADVSNYSSTRLEGMINVPLVDDAVALRLAGAWTKRDGFVTNQISGEPIDGRDLWSTRLSLRFAPTDSFDANLIWEHFQEDDDRLRSGKQLCKRDDRTEIQGHAVSPVPIGTQYLLAFNQGCLPTSMYSPESFQAPNGLSLPYFRPLGIIGVPISGYHDYFDPYASLTQSSDLRVIESTVDPDYRAKSDLFELQISFDLTDELTLASETAYSADAVFAMQDLNRFNTRSGAFQSPSNPEGNATVRPNLLLEGPNGGIFCDPQIGCADRLVGIDLSTGDMRQFSQELRLSSDYEGPLNFSLGANFLRADITDKYYVFINTLGMYSAKPYAGGHALGEWIPGVSDNTECLRRGLELPDPDQVYDIRECIYIDPNPIGSLNDMGHNYFLSKNPYKLISYAVFGEAYYNLTDNLKLTAGLRWTVDKKEAPRIPSWLFTKNTAGYPVMETIQQEWREPTGRLALDWKPDLTFTDETLLYASYARGYKAGGTNPPLPGTSVWDTEKNGAKLREASLLKPKTFDAEYVDAFELGMKNTLLDASLTVNLAAFYYDYKNYQISQIIDRSAVNYNFDAKVWGIELEADWRPLENLKLGFKGGYENTRVGKGESAIDIMDRTAGREGWVVVRPFPTSTSNCVLPIYTVAVDDGPLTTDLPGEGAEQSFLNGSMGPCEFAYLNLNDAVTDKPYIPDPPNVYPGYPGFDPLAGTPGHPYTGQNTYNGVDYGPAPNNGEGFLKDLGGNELPNAPNFTATITADYTIPFGNWLATLHTDLYYQSEAWTRIFNMEGYDKLKAYSNINVAAIFTNEDAGWKVMAYVKNVLDRDSITGAFLFPDDVGLTTNVFLTEPRLYGVRVTKDFTGGPWWTGAASEGPFPLTVELGGQVQHQVAPYEPLVASFADNFAEAIRPGDGQNRDLDWGDGREVKVVYRPGQRWSVFASYRTGATNSETTRIHKAQSTGPKRCGFLPPLTGFCDPENEAKYFPGALLSGTNWSDSSARSREEHVMVDFGVGMDVGLGLGLSRSSLAMALRYGEFKSTTEAAMSGTPDWHIVDGWTEAANYPSRHRYDSAFFAERAFEGAGPVVTWDAAATLLGDAGQGHIDVDWSLGASVLFGRQKSSITGFEQEGYSKAAYVTYPTQLPLDPPVPVDIRRSGSAMVPVLDLSLGLSYEIQRVKLSAGYRWERYYNALDVGYDKASNADRTIDGPYFKFAIGFGG